MKLYEQYTISPRNAIGFKGDSVLLQLCILLLSMELVVAESKDAFIGNTSQTFLTCAISIQWNAAGKVPDHGPDSSDPETGVTGFGIKETDPERKDEVQLC